MKSIKKYSSKWPKIFRREKEKLKKVFYKYKVDIQHIGSTSVPKLDAKPIIDIAVKVKSMDKIKVIINKLEKVGYLYQPERSSPERFFFKKKAFNSFHLSITDNRFTYWKRQILFRDYLKKNSSLRIEYANLKRELSKENSKLSNFYTSGKSTFIYKVLNKAMFDKFYKKNPLQIKTLIEEFVRMNIFTKIPKLKKISSIVITGSVALKNYDKYSDIDIHIILSKKNLDENKENLRSLKKELKKTNQVVQIFFNTYEEIKELKSWHKDQLLSIFTNSIIVYDHKNKFLNIQKTIKCYPKDVYKEKLNWLFAESVFQLFDRYEVAMKRKNKFALLNYKLVIIQLFLFIIYLLNKEYPVSKKHLLPYFKKFKYKPKGLENKIKKLLKENDPKICYDLLLKILYNIEKELIRKKMITKEDEQYWINYRSRYKVQL